MKKLLLLLGLVLNSCAHEVVPEPVTWGSEAAREQALGDAKVFYTDNKFTDAVSAILSYLEQGGERAKALRLLGACYCALKQPKKVFSTISELDALSELYVRHICNRHGVIVPTALVVR